MKLTSYAFNHNEQIPLEYTCDGKNISPPLTWENAPRETETFVLIVDSHNAPSDAWVHWILFNIPAGTTMLTENARTDIFSTGASDFDNAQRYGGPCPSSGTHNSYHFKLYALDAKLDLPDGATKEQILEKMHGHVLDDTVLIGKYERK